MSAVTADEVEAVLTDSRQGLSVMAAAVAAASAAFRADPSAVNLDALCQQHTNHKRQENLVSFLEAWAAGLGFEVAA